MKATIVVAERVEITPEGVNLRKAWPTDIPVGRAFEILMMVDGDPSEAGPHELQLVASDADGQELVRSQIPFNLPVGPYPRSTWPAQIPGVRAPGRYSLVLRVDGVRLAHYDFGVFARGHGFA